MGLLGRDYDQHCWGRDLLALDSGDPGVAIIKPSGSDFSTAIIEGSHILVRATPDQSRLYRYVTQPHLQATLAPDTVREQQLKILMDAYIQTATQALRDNRVGHSNVR